MPSWNTSTITWPVWTYEWHTWTHTVVFRADEHEFTSEQATSALIKFFGITTDLTVDITQSVASSLRQVHLRLHQTTRQKYAVITIQRLLTAIIHSVCGYNSLYNPITITKYMSFDKRVHTTYYNTTKSTISPPLYTTFVDRPHNGFHILFFLVNQLKTRAHELYVRLYSVDGKQHAHPHAPIAALKHNHTRTPTSSMIPLSVSVYTSFIYATPIILYSPPYYKTSYTRNPLFISLVYSQHHYFLSMAPPSPPRAQSFPYPIHSPTEITQVTLHYNR